MRLAQLIGSGFIGHGIIRTVDKTRLVKRLGQTSQDEKKLVLGILAEMFAE